MARRGPTGGAAASLAAANDCLWVQGKASWCGTLEPAPANAGCGAEGALTWLHLWLLPLLQGGACLGGLYTAQQTQGIPTCCITSRL